MTIAAPRTPSAVPLRAGAPGEYLEATYADLHDIIHRPARRFWRILWSLLRDQVPAAMRADARAPARRDAAVRERRGRGILAGLQLPGPHRHVREPGPDRHRGARRVVDRWTAERHAIGGGVGAAADQQHRRVGVRLSVPASSLDSARSTSSASTDFHSAPSSRSPASTASPAGCSTSSSRMAAWSCRASASPARPAPCSAKRWCGPAR